MNSDLIESARKQLEDIVSFFGVNASVSASGEVDTIKLSVEVETGGHLIGHRGETLAALQHIMNMIIRRQTDERIYVHVDVGGYREARLSKLEEQAREAAEKAKSEDTEVALPMMTAAERRHIHSVLTDIEGVSSESRGEGNRRRLIVKPS